MIIARATVQDSVASAAAASTAPDAGDSLALQEVAVQPTVPERSGPPDTSYYMKLGYVVAGALFLAYIVLLLRRVASVRKPL